MEELGKKYLLVVYKILQISLSDVIKTSGEITDSSRMFCIYTTSKINLF